MIPTETLFIAGPTGVGKTVLALDLAVKLRGEIVGVDAFQLYAGLPLLTAQPTREQQAIIPHHLIGVIDPLESVDAGRYLRTVQPLLHEIVARGKIPLLVGGTGFYLKALLGGLDKLPERNSSLREEFAMLDLSTLIARLQKADPASFSKIDLANRRRVERALEIVLLTGQPLAASHTRAKAPLPLGVCGLLVTRDREELNERIARNVFAMFERGVEAEIAALSEEKIGPTAAMTLGLREIRSLLRGEISRPEAIEAITLATRRYAKRQMTWFRNQHDFPVLNLSQFSNSTQAVAEALCLLKKN